MVSNPLSAGRRQWCFACHRQFLLLQKYWITTASMRTNRRALEEFDKIVDGARAAQFFFTLGD